MYGELFSLQIRNFITRFHWCMNIVEITIKFPCHISCDEIYSFVASHAILTRNIFPVKVLTVLSAWSRCRIYIYM